MAQMAEMGTNNLRLVRRDCAGSATVAKQDSAVELSTFALLSNPYYEETAEYDF